METTFRLRNWLSVSVFFFLIFGVISRIAIAVPATLHLAVYPGVVFGARDAQHWATRLLAGASASGILAAVNHQRLATRKDSAGE